MEAPLHKVCGTRHWSSQACPATKSTAARKDVPTTAQIPVVQGHPPKAASDKAGELQAAGIKPPPVDTSAPAVIAEGIAAKRGRGRPRLANPKSPRAAYQRDLMRRRYAAKKADQSKRED